MSQSRKGQMNLFIRDGLGRIAGRVPGVWSTHFAKCLDCGTTDKPHEAEGYCQPCYVRYKRRTDAGYRDRANASSKRKSLRSDWQERYDTARRSDPKRQAQRREICLRWAKKNAKFAPGKRVERELIPGFWAVGVVLENGRGRCLVQFKTSQELISHNQLRLATEAA